MYSIGYHTKYPEKTSFYTALMLAKGGEAYLTIDITELLFRLSKFKFKQALPKEKFRLLLEYSRKYLLKYFRSALESYNKLYGTNLNFELELFERPTRGQVFVLRIKRIS